MVVVVLLGAVVFVVVVVDVVVEVDLRIFATTTVKKRFSRFRCNPQDAHIGSSSGSSSSGSSGSSGSSSGSTE